MKLSSSPRINLLLTKMGIFGYEDVVSFFPRRYDYLFYSSLDEINSLQDKGRVVLLGKLIAQPRTLRFARASSTKFYFRDSYGHDHLIVAWNRPYLSSSLDLVSSFTLVAIFDKRNHCLNLVNIKKGKVSESESIVPVYSLPKEYPDHSFRQLEKKALESLRGSIRDIVPSFLREKYHLLNREVSLNEIHFPSSKEGLHQAKRLLKYEEALIFSLRTQLIRKENKKAIKDESRFIDRLQLEDFISKLPFKLTSSQMKAIDEGFSDLNSPSLMYRLLQGDVGTGKTMVAATLMYANYLRNKQSALLAPTEALAKQHYETLSKVFSPFNIKPLLLDGSLSLAERKECLSKIRSGEGQIIVGTHALFSNDVIYHCLGLAVIDEQHKFGVSQRTTLANKGDCADLLLMSATPIPRTLSLTLFGDLDVSSLNEFPSGKRNVDTRIIKSDNPFIEKAIARSLEVGGRVYIVAPKIENNEVSTSSVKEVYSRFNDTFPNKVSLLHGKMSEEEKRAALTLFKEGITPIIVSTSIIEVGIDVKPANLMIVFDASSFSLSSLHQLRGRIGRDGKGALTLLCYDEQDQDDLDKLGVLVRSDDGFFIAEEDLRRRGMGEVAGTRQSGEADFALANIVLDIRMFEAARDDAAFILSHPLNEESRKIVELASSKNKGISLA